MTGKPDNFERWNQRAKIATTISDAVRHLLWTLLLAVVVVAVAVTSLRDPEQALHYLESLGPLAGR
jgi:hypothetical protein